MPRFSNKALILPYFSEEKNLWDWLYAYLNYTLSPVTENPYCNGILIRCFRTEHKYKLDIGQIKKSPILGRFFKTWKCITEFKKILSIIGFIEIKQKGMSTTNTNPLHSLLLTSARYCLHLEMVSSGHKHVRKGTECWRSI